MGQECGLSHTDDKLGDRQLDLSIETGKRPSFSSKLPKGSSIVFLVLKAFVSKLISSPRIIANIVSEREQRICFDCCKNLCYTNCAKFFPKRTWCCTLKFSLWKRGSSQDFSKSMQMFNCLPQRGYIKFCITLETLSMTRSPNHGTSPP